MEETIGKYAPVVSNQTAKDSAHFEKDIDTGAAVELRCMRFYEIYMLGPLHYIYMDR